MKPKTGSLKNINKINKPLLRLSKGKIKRKQITNIRSERRDSLTDSLDIERFMKIYYELCAHKFDNQNKMN